MLMREFPLFWLDLPIQTHGGQKQPANFSEILTVIANKLIRILQLITLIHPKFKSLL